MANISQQKRQKMQVVSLKFTTFLYFWWYNMVDKMGNKL